MESLYLALGFFVIVPFVYDVVPQIKNKKIVYAGLIVIVLIRLSMIGMTSQKYTTRLEWNQNLLKNTKALPDKKIVFNNEIISKDTILLVWGSSFELLLLSSLEHPDSSRCLIISDTPERYGPSLNENKSFFTEVENYHYDQLPDYYFNFKDTSNYKIIEKKESTNTI
jgi:hypothetical protein